ncbi:Cerato-platanin domain containing protein [Russula decolorans]|jgi:hypothetical protein
MIYFTILIFTLLLSHIARAMPACGDVASPEDQVEYDTYGDDELVLATYKVSWNAKYDDPNGSTNSVACSNGPHGLAPKYPYFRNFPDFPYLGGSYDISHGSSNCGKCWKLSYKGRSIYFTSIDGYGGGYSIGRKAYIALYGGTGGPGSLDANAQSVPGHFCGFK